MKQTTSSNSSTQGNSTAANIVGAALPFYYNIDTYYQVHDNIYVQHTRMVRRALLIDTAPPLAGSDYCCRRVPRWPLGIGEALVLLIPLATDRTER